MLAFTVLRGFYILQLSCISISWLEDLVLAVTQLQLGMMVESWYKREVLQLYNCNFYNSATQIVNSYENREPSPDEISLAQKEEISNFDAAILSAFDSK